MIYFRKEGLKLSAADYLKDLCLQLRDGLQPLIDEITATGTLKSRAGVDIQGEGEWRVQVRNEKNTLVSVIMGIELSAAQKHDLETYLFGDHPSKKRWIEIKRSPSEIEIAHEDREPYSITTWTVDQYMSRLPATRRPLFRATIEKLLAGETPGNVTLKDDQTLLINLDGFTVLAEWKSSSLPQVP